MDLSFHAGHLSHPNIMENSLIGDKVAPAIGYDLANIPSAKRFQTATLTGSNAPSLPAKHGEPRPETV